MYGLSLAEFNPVSGCNEDVNRSNQKSLVEEHSTKFSNFQLNVPELQAKKYVEREELEGSKTFDQSPRMSDATKFSSDEANDATKTSISDEKRRRERDLNSVVILEETKYEQTSSSMDAIKFNSLDE